MGAEDPNSLAAELDALETSKGPAAITCQWWKAADPDLREAVIRNVKAKGHTIVTRHLRSRQLRVTSDGIRDHVAGKCARCQI